MDERRKLPRKYLMAYSSVYNQNDGQLLGYLCDLTLSGLMVISKESKQIGTEREIRIDLPETPVFPKKSLVFKTRVIWCQPDVDPRLHNIGFQLLNLAPEDKPIIEQMIETYEFRRDQDAYPPSIDELNKKT
ncbi:MAG: hypothetical protein B5M51_02555 [Anaerolinea sp. 4484_236]|nr:MAG: hypothetical protein B5M51_02555 [Anaerolinea sp. 4484_236]